MPVTISDELAGDVEQALNLAIGMAIMHAPGAGQRLIDTATRLTNAINEVSADDS